MDRGNSPTSLPRQTSTILLDDDLPIPALFTATTLKYCRGNSGTSDTVWEVVLLLVLMVVLSTKLSLVLYSIS